MCEQEVGAVLLKPKLMNYPGGHGEGRDSCGTDHGVDLLLGEEVDQLGEEYAAGGIKDKCNESQAQDQQGFRIQEGIGLHLLGNGEAEEECDQICQNRLRRVGQGIQNATFPDQISEHQEADQGHCVGCDDSGQDGNKDGEDDLRRF